MEILARAKELERLGRNVIHMEIGEPDFPTPPLVLHAARSFLEQGSVTYTPAGGIPELREAIARHYRERYGVLVASAQVFVTPGASGAFLLILAMTVAPGNRVLLTDPGYPCYANLVRLFGGEAASIPVNADTNFHLTRELLDSHWITETAGTIVASPSNPTGTVISPDILRDLIHISDERGGFFISDEIYHGLEYSGKSPTALEFSDKVFVVNSFSKYFGMTGWRVGWTVVPRAFIEQAERLAQNLFISAPEPGQRAALAALSLECRAELELRRRQFEERRDFLLMRLKDLGFAVPIRPDGAFYVYADCRAHTDDSSKLALHILEQTGVALTPGKDFGEHQARRFLRFSYTCSIDRLCLAMEKLQNYLETEQTAAITSAKSRP